VTLDALMKTAAELDLSPRALRLEPEELPQLQLPAILHWDLSHFVVLESVDRRGVTILDPAAGRRRITMAEVSRSFTGVALELSPTRGFNRVEARSRIRLKDLWSRLTNYGPAAAQILGLSVLLQATVLLMPLFVQLTVDQAIGQNDANLLTVLLAGFAIVYALAAVTALLRSWVVLTVSESLSYQLAGNIVRHLLRLRVDYFERRHVGDLLSRIGSIGPIKELLTQGVINVVIDSILAITTVIVMALISPTLTLLVVVTTFVYFLISMIMYPGLRRRTEEEIVARARTDTHLMESMRAFRAIKLHTHEAMRESGWRNHYADVISASYRSGMYGIRLNLSEAIIFNGQFLLLVFLGATAVMTQDLTIGLLLAFLAYRTSFVSSASALIDQIQQWRLVGVHLDRLSDIVVQTPEPLVITPARELLPGPKCAARASPSATIPATRRSSRISTSPFPAGAWCDHRPVGRRQDHFHAHGARPAQPQRGPAAGRWAAPDARHHRRLAQPHRRGDAGRSSAHRNPVRQHHLLRQRARPGRPSQRLPPRAHPRRHHEDADGLSQPGRRHGRGALLGPAPAHPARPRALPRPDVLFLDEGTANLDEETERRVVDTIAALPITRIVIAHRPLLIERADLVLRLEGGKLHKVERRPKAKTPEIWMAGR
jgi:ATP-binding cassette subfamily B protein RaxB